MDIRHWISFNLKYNFNNDHILTIFGRGLFQEVCYSILLKAKVEHLSQVREQLAGTTQIRDISLAENIASGRVS